MVGDPDDVVLQGRPPRDESGSECLSIRFNFINFIRKSTHKNFANCHSGRNRDVLRGEVGVVAGKLEKCMRGPRDKVLPPAGPVVPRVVDSIRFSPNPTQKKSSRRLLRRAAPLGLALNWPQWPQRAL